MTLSERFASVIVNGFIGAVFAVMLLFLKAPDWAAGACAGLLIALNVGVDEIKFAIARVPDAHS